MKKGFFLILMLLCVQISYAQLDTKSFYLSASLSGGNVLAGNVDLNLIVKEKYSFSLGARQALYDAKAIPEDFHGSLAILFFDDPKNIYTTYYFTAGRILNLNPKGTIRCNLNAGVGFTKAKYPTNFRPVDTFLLLTRNYDWDIESKNMASFIFEPSIEFPFTKYFGLSFSPFLEINEDKTSYGLGIGLMLGKLSTQH